MKQLLTRYIHCLGIVLILLILAGCIYGPRSDEHEEIGLASWYGKDFHGKTTSSGERYDMFKYTAAHRTLPLGTKVKVTNLSNGKDVVVRINDRGPFVEGRIIDLSYVAARKLDIIESGTAKVRIEVLD